MALSFYATQHHKFPDPDHIFAKMHIGGKFTIADVSIITVLSKKKTVYSVTLCSRRGKTRTTVVLDMHQRLFSDVFSRTSYAREVFSVMQSKLVMLVLQESYAYTVFFLHTCPIWSTPAISTGFHRLSNAKESYSYSYWYCKSCVYNSFS